MFTLEWKCSLSNSFLGVCISYFSLVEDFTMEGCNLYKVTNQNVLFL